VGGRLRAYKNWRLMEQATMSYGYGLSASLFQLAQAYTIFARDGEFIPATLRVQNDTVYGSRVFKAEHAKAVRNMLYMVTQAGGTAPKAQVMGYTVGGKTGTAHKQEGKGYAEHKYRSFFVGVAPIESPRIVVAVMVDEPNNGEYYGGLVAAPVFSDTVQQTLRIMGVKPDINVKPQQGVEMVEESF
jgi:cell division protein FtsI (penicillin-binding protein 3)